MLSGVPRWLMNGSFSNFNWTNPFLLFSSWPTYLLFFLATVGKRLKNSLPLLYDKISYFYSITFEQGYRVTMNYFHRRKLEKEHRKVAVHECKISQCTVKILSIIRASSSTCFLSLIVSHNNFIRIFSSY